MRKSIWLSLLILVAVAAAGCTPTPVPTLTVNTTDDVNDGNCNATHCSLREAIIAANTYSGSVTISFNIGGGGVQTIRPESFYNDIFASVTIDGTTQPGYAGTPLIELDGSLAGLAYGLYLRGNNSTVQGLVINRFEGGGIRVRAEDAVIRGNYIGTDVTGTIAMGNSYNGIDVCCDFNNPPHATIGGLAPEDRNIISGNGTNGVSLDQYYGTVTHEGGNVVQGNYIGTDVTGTVALPNGGDGILIVDSSHNSIGGSAPGAGNVISGNTANGVGIAGAPSEENLVWGNYIGTDAAGATALGNQRSGVVIAAASHNQIGTNITGARNIISANLHHGVLIQDNSSQKNEVMGNYIGTDVTGNLPLGNMRNGIWSEGDVIAIGGENPGMGNVISANGINGVEINQGSTLIKGNYIGTNAGGTAALANGVGVRIRACDMDTAVGGTPAGARNVISGNDDEGIYVVDGGCPHHDVTIIGNFIGTDSGGMNPLGNTVGVRIASPDVELGFALAGGGNVISGNHSHGVLLQSSGAVVRGNFIGTDAGNTVDVGNGGHGVLIDTGAADNLLSENRIAFNNLDGVALPAGTGTGNTITKNGIRENGLLGIAIEGDTVLPNDYQDPDTGANDRQNSPVLTSAFSDIIPYETTFEGTINSTPGTALTVEFFTSTACDPSGHGEGAEYLTNISVTTDINGNAVLFFFTSSGYLDSTNFITATATDPFGNTSEFSNCIQVEELNPLTPTPALSVMEFHPFFDQPEIFFGPRCTPDEVRISVEIVNPPEPISYVLLFVRLKDQATGETTSWDGGWTMLSSKENWFYYDLSAYDVPEYKKFKSAWLQFQFVAYNAAQEKIGYSDVFDDIAFSSCNQKQ